MEFVYATAVGPRIYLETILRLSSLATEPKGGYVHLDLTSSLLDTYICDPPCSYIRMDIRLQVRKHDFQAGEVSVQAQTWRQAIEQALET